MSVVASITSKSQTTEHWSYLKVARTQTQWLLRS